MKQVIFFSDDKNHQPFWEFFKKLDNTYKIIIQKRLRRIEQKGHLGNVKNLKDGVWELKFDNGIRIYYGLDGDVLVVILAGSLKDNQEKVIKEAKKYWEDYKNLFN